MRTAMRRITYAIVVALGLVVAMAPVASADPPDNKLVFEVTCDFGDGPVPLEARNPNQQAVWVAQATLVVGQTDAGVGIVFGAPEETRGEAPLEQRGLYDRLVTCLVDLSPVGVPVTVPVQVLATGQPT
jgi:hypothetical protein